MSGKSFLSFSFDQHCNSVEYCGAQSVCRRTWHLLQKRQDQIPAATLPRSLSLRSSTHTLSVRMSSRSRTCLAACDAFHTRVFALARHAQGEPLQNRRHEESATRPAMPGYVSTRVGRQQTVSGQQASSLLCSHFPVTTTTAVALP